MRAARVFIAAMLMSLVPVAALAHAPAEEPRPFAWDVARAVLIDPTTYAPALISHEAIRQDWKTSRQQRERARRRAFARHALPHIERHSSAHCRGPSGSLLRRS